MHTLTHRSRSSGFRVIRVFRGKLFCLVLIQRGATLTVRHEVQLTVSEAKQPFRDAPSAFTS